MEFSEDRWAQKGDAPAAHSRWSMAYHTTSKPLRSDSPHAGSSLELLHDPPGGDVLRYRDANDALETQLFEAVAHARPRASSSYKPRPHKERSTRQPTSVLCSPSGHCSW